MNTTFMRKLSSAFLAYSIISLLLISSGCTTGYTATTYDGREDDAPWRKAALERIEKIRKGDIIVLVVDAKGNRLRGAKVRVTMRRHSFAFGSAVSAHYLTHNSDDGKRYREVVERCFNKVVLENDLKWGLWEQSMRRDPKDFYNIDNTFAALRWLRDRDIRVRGHFVAWGPLDGEFGTSGHAEKDGPGFRDALMRHAEEEVRQVGDLVLEWDVVNHPLGWGQGTIRDIAGDDIYDTMFRNVREWNPRAVRFINEGGVIPPYNEKQINSYYQLIAGMLSRGVPVQGIGFMGHFFLDRDLMPPVKMLDILDRYSALGLPLQITEFDVRYGKAGETVQLTDEQEKLQADYTRDFLITMFSHPSVVGVVMWGFWEARHWYPSAALYRRDWSVKPNGRVWEDLVLRQWWTNASGATDADGRFSTRGFLGDYSVEAEVGGRKGSVKQFSLGTSGASVRVVVQ